jgi:hypothetical protein
MILTNTRSSFPLTLGSGRQTLLVTFRAEGSGNSGVFFHSEFKPGTPTITQGLQFEIDCRIGQHTGGLYGDGRQWIVWPAPENETVVRAGDWLVVSGQLGIDPATGVVSLLRYSVCDDFGVAVNPLLLAGQVHGGVSQASTERTSPEEHPTAQ